MSILTTVTSNLAGGVSQQGRATRLDNQLIEQINGYSTVVDGLTKRPPTKFKRVLEDYAWGNYTLHTFRRNPTEEYLVVAGNDYLRVFDTEGIEYPVSSGPLGGLLDTDYLDLFGYTSSDGQFEKFTFFAAGPEMVLDPDFTLPAPFVRKSHDVRIYTKTPGVLDVGEVTALAEAGVAALVVWSLCVRAHSDSPQASFRVGAKNATDDRVYTEFKFNADGKPEIQSQVAGAQGGVKEIGGGWWRVWTLVDQDLLQGIYNRMFFGIVAGTVDQSLIVWGPRTHVGVTSPPDYYLSPDNIRMTTVQDTTFVTNATVVPKLEETVTELDEVAPSSVWVRQGAYSTKYEVSVVMDISGIRTSGTAIVETWDGVNAAFPGTVNLNSIDTKEIATKIKAELETAPAAPGEDPFSTWIAGNYFDIEVHGSQVFIKPLVEFVKVDSITTSDGIGDSALVALHESVEEFSDLPKQSLDGFTIEVTGLPGEELDNYWVKFKTDSQEEFGEGSWSEIPAPGVPFEFDAETMPHVLTREVDSLLGTIYFAFKPAEWGDRLAGDEETVPPISPVVNESGIQEVFFYKNRLGFLSDQNVILSASGRYFDFWQASARDLRDDDPIDVSINSRDASRIDYAVEFFDRLLLQTSEGQWSLTGEPTFTARTVEARLVSSYESIPGVRPASTGESLFLPYPQGGFSAVRELFPTNDTRLTAADISEQVPRYITGTILDMVASSTEECLLVRADGDRSCLFVYKWMDGGGQRVQSAWFKFTFADAQVVAATMIESVAFLLIRRSGSLQLECMDLAGQNETVHLDRQIGSDHPAVSFVYDDVEKVTRITIPWNPGYNADYQVVTASGKAHKAYYTDYVTLEVEADVTGEGFTIGERYLLDVILAEPVFRQNNSRGGRSQVGEGRYQLLHAWLFADETGYVTATNTAQGVSTVDEFGDATNRSSFTDKLRVPLLCSADQVRLRLRNYSPFSTRLTSVEWVGRYSTRAAGRAG